ncbi:hypothetical protein VOLCADRAFT_74185 [Volvox carteri f. nagariensis]|uniref:Activator of Hsp90 ATPase AHSA1-like N-terminal domain-containing protein n=1 Tax=Volvox carteri f. nagariensis TaxID=3068 RepID=D8TSG7_VOLCA|nr:uncharacterized protein VOLCADRAFT_74185 [Volvox carteri f. nagariensis]EFJ49368.1 hypothetical protein VOLCADRAFT_74185 [Volvox carteri f. nagariensis]|eukprot:XP_002949349.1 hypothetical protein VOLCADRAFT_74185 [Volvox carteri f. nagariensis]
MARFEEADPRWLVKDMGDAGRNVNNWHWTERDCTDWAKQRLSEVLAGIQLTQSPAAVRTTTLESMSGDAFLNIRKNKLIPSYDLEVRVGWTGELTNGNGQVVGTATGKLHLPHIGDDNHDEDPEIRIVCDTNTSEAERLKAAVHSHGKRPLLAAVHKFVAELRSGGPALAEAAAPIGSDGGVNGQGDDSAAGAANGSGAANGAASKPKLSSADADKARAAAAKAPATAHSSSSSGRSISLTAKFHCRPADIYECFTVEGRVRAFSQSTAIVQPTAPGGSFSWYGGSITGEFLELSAPHRIVMKWRFNTWEEGCYSKVVVEISEPEYGNTVLKLMQTGVPPHDKFGNEDTQDVTERGWQSQVLQRIRQVFGYGV